MPIDLVHLPILSILIWLPLIGALILIAFPASYNKDICSHSFFQRLNLPKFWTALITLSVLVVSILILSGFDKTIPTFQHVEKNVWIPSIGATYALGIDGISLPFVVLTTLIFFIVTVFTTSESLNKKNFNNRGFFVSLLVLETSLLGGFLSLDLFLFYIFWELMLIPIFYQIGVFGGKNRSKASYKFLIYTLAGSVLMLLAIIFLSYKFHSQTSNAFGQGTLTFLYNDFLNVQLNINEQILLFIAFAFAFAVKLPIFPFHTWLPDAYNEAPDSGTAILSSTVSKIGLYGLIRFCLPFFPLAGQGLSNILAVLAVIGIIYAALLAWSQTELKKIIAYSSVSHLGFCVLGVCAMREGALTGSIFQAVSHGIITALLFLLIGFIYERYNTYEIKDIRSLATKAPGLTFVFFITLLGSISLPLTSGFVGEFLILSESYNTYPRLTITASIATVLASVYMFSLFKEIFFKDEELGIVDQKNYSFTLLQLTAVVPMISLILFLGIKSSYVTNLAEISIKKLISSSDFTTESNSKSKLKGSEFLKENSKKEKPSLI